MEVIYSSSDHDYDSGGEKIKQAWTREDRERVGHHQCVLRRVNEAIKLVSVQLHRET